MTEIVEHLLTTKLYRPLPRKSLIKRPELFTRLQSSLHIPLTLLCAPAGFGKTTLLTSWLEQLPKQEDLSVVWLSLDEDDNDPNRFWRYLRAAFEQASSVHLKLERDPALTLIDQITILLHALTSQSTTFLLILDDCHFLHAQTVLNAISHLLQYLPSNVHLFISSRSEPDLPLSRFRVRNQLLEFRSADLRFSQQEAAEFLYSVLGVHLSPHDLFTLDKQVEGWIAGLQLAALSMQGRNNFTAFVSAFAGSHRYIADYLTDEVLNTLSEATQTFLLTTSVLDQLSAPLCTVLTGSPDAQKQLEQLERDNIFLLPLDDERHWYRYHHLFADMLRQRLKRAYPELVSVLHLKASLWYEQQGDFSSAIEHALAATEYERAALLLERFSGKLMKHGEMFTLQRWLEQLPEALLMLHVQLCLYSVWTLLATGQWNKVEQRIQHIELHLTQLPEGENAYLLSSLLSARAALAYGHGDTACAITLSLQALEQVAPDDFSRRSFITLHLGMAYWLNGDIPNALATMIRAREESQLANAHYSMQVAIYSLAQLQFIQGQLNQAYQTYLQGLPYSVESVENEHPANGFLYYGLGVLEYERNQLEKAAFNLSRAVRLSQRIGDVRLLPISLLALAKVSFVQGDHEQARKQTEEALQFVREGQITYLFPVAMTSLAQLCLTSGDLAEAESLLDACHLDKNPSSLRMNQVEYTVLVRLYLAQGKTAEALSLLQTLEQGARRDGRGHHHLQLQLLLARVYDLLGNSTQALNLLYEVLTQAEPENYLRLFLDEGPILVDLLIALKKHLLTKTLPGDENSSTRILTYIHRLLSLLGENDPEISVSSSTQFLADPLSERELQILQLIASGLTNQEIIEHLYIAMSTLKTHINHIYSKLSVRTRTQAILQARSLHLL